MSSFEGGYWSLCRCEIGVGGGEDGPWARWGHSRALQLGGWRNWGGSGVSSPSGGALTLPWRVTPAFRGWGGGN